MSDQVEILLAPAMARLDELAALDPGWLDGTHPAAIPLDLIGRVRTTMRDLAQHSAPMPTLFPTGDGGIEADWQLPPWDVTCTWEAGGTAYLHALHLDTDAVHDADLDPTDRDAMHHAITSLLDSIT